MGAPGEYRGIAALAAGFRDGTLNPTAVTEAALACAAEVEPVLNAFVGSLAETAMDAARQAGAELARGKDRGPLHGIPVAIKDLIAVKDAPTGYGSRVLPPEIANEDAPLVAQLREAGAVIVAKTNLLEYAYGVAHPDIGQTNNPHDPSRTAGGSSGGSAAAVAAGVVPLAIGTDTGGSIRIPAAYCGIVGLKPSFGLVPLDGVFPLSWSLDHAGPLARSVEDAALGLAAMTGGPMPLSSRPLAGLRIGILSQHCDAAVVTQDVRTSIAQALRILRDGGAELTEMSIPGLGEANAALIDILLPEASVIHKELLAANPGGYAPGTRSQVEAGFKEPATDYVEAMRLRARFRADVEAAFAHVDVLLSPSVAFVAPAEDPEIGSEGEGDGEMLASGFANLSGHPAISLPCGFAGALPIGLQLVGPLMRDAGLLSHAQAVEKALGAYRPPN